MSKLKVKSRSKHAQVLLFSELRDLSLGRKTKRK